MAVAVKTLEAKKSQPIATPTRQEDVAVTGAGVADFLGDVKEELFRINWTSPEELRVYTKIVVGMTFVLGMGIYVIDLFIQNFLHGLNHFLQWIS